MPDGVTVTSKVSPTESVQTFTKDEVTPIAGLLGLDTHNVSDSDSLSIKEIYDYVRGDAKEMSEIELLSKLRTLETRLGMTSLGERRLDKIHRYVKLQSQIEGLEKARDRELR